MGVVAPGEKKKELETRSKESVLEINELLHHPFSALVVPHIN